MKQGWLLIIVVPLIFALSASTYGQDAPAVQNVKTVTGQVKAIDGQTSTIREQSGNEVSLKIDSETKLDGLINMGDRVTASVEPNGRVMSLKQLSNASSTKIIR